MKDSEIMKKLSIYILIKTCNKGSSQPAWRNRKVVRL